MDHQKEEKRVSLEGCDKRTVRKGVHKGAIPKTLLGVVDKGKSLCVARFRR
jgi:hypothetical protein